MSFDLSMPILVVDDYATMIRIIRNLLKQLGFAPSFAAQTGGQSGTASSLFRRFQAGQVHHLALELPIEDFFMGGIVNKYFGQSTDPIYWAVWTNLEGQ